MKAYIRVSFFKKEDSDNDMTIQEIVDCLPVKPDEFWLKDDVRIGSMKEKFDGFEYKFEHDEPVDYVRQEVISLLERIQLIKPKLLELGNQFDAVLLVAIYTYGQTNPGVYLDKNSVRLLNNLECEVDFDIYSTNDEEIVEEEIDETTAGCYCEIPTDGPDSDIKDLN